MERLQCNIGEHELTLFLKQQTLIQVFCQQQALVVDNPAQTHYYEFELGGQRIGLDTTQVEARQMDVFVNGERIQTLGLPARQEVKSKASLIGLAALGFKLLKSAKVVKAGLAAASVAGYAWLFSFEFAIMLVTCLVVHEYGHVRAMQYFGIKTKGFYLIPFVGGLALSDEKVTTRWQDVVISIMGPAFGLFTSVLGVVLYYLTGMEVFAGVAVLSALVNLFNLLPVLPLDGGHVLKSISFSMRSWVGLSVCLGGIALGLWVSYIFGLMLLVFFIFIGSLEVVFEWKERHNSHLIPLDRYGQVFSAVMYVVVVVGHVGVMMLFANSDSAILRLPFTILSQ